MNRAGPRVTGFDPRLDAAYRATTYRVDAADRRFELRVDHSHAGLDHWLATQGATGWVWISAENPASTRLGADENARRTDALSRILRSRHDRVFPAESEADGGDWPVEHGLFVLGMSTDEAIRLARRFGQHAIVSGVCGSPAQLVWVSTGGT